MSKRGTSLHINKTAWCQLAGCGLLVSTYPLLASNDAHGCVQSGQGLADDTAIIIIVQPLSFLLLIIDVNELSRPSVSDYWSSTSFLVVLGRSRKHTPFFMLFYEKEQQIAHKKG
jgi:hypothetical protein